MQPKPHVTLCLILFLTGLAQTKSSHQQFTVEVKAGDENCFFIAGVQKGQTMDFEFQVTDNNSPTGNNDISVTIESPKPQEDVIYSAEEEEDGSFNGELEEDGDYQVCLDNDMSTWTDKVVWFEVAITDPYDDYYDYGIDSEEMNEIKERNEDTEDLYDMKMEDIKDRVHKVRVNVGKMRHFQYMQSADMSTDTHHVEYNKYTIDLWSILHLSLMFIVGFIQVYMVKNLFEDKSMLHKFKRSMPVSQPHDNNYYHVPI